MKGRSLVSRLEIPENIRKDLIKKHYGIVGRHSAVQICSWTKKALRREGVCYKQKFYGIECHRCAQMSPAAIWCQENCIYCWRPMEFMRDITMDEESVDPPEFIIEETIKQRWRLLSGMKASKKVDMKLLMESRIPSHWAISLSGEPTIYPKIDELIKKLKGREEVKSIFLVTNAQLPHVFEKLRDNDALPTQLYFSVTSPRKELFKKIHRPVYKDAWERLWKSIEIFRNLKTRRVMRLTIIKGFNDSEDLLEDFAEMFEYARPDFIEVKAYMYLGYSTMRLKRENMPTHEYIREFSEKLLEHLDSYYFMDEAPPSRIVVLKNKKSPYDDKIIKRK
ncbi:MAG: 4-demethylwyosine synthase TYW1 [Candidatus Asgardarchaeia archaeon]